MATAKRVKLDVSAALTAPLAPSLDDLICQLPDLIPTILNMRAESRLLDVLEHFFYPLYDLPDCEKSVAHSNSARAVLNLCKFIRDKNVVISGSTVVKAFLGGDDPDGWQPGDPTHSWQPGDLDLFCDYNDFDATAKILSSQLNKIFFPDCNKGPILEEDEFCSYTRLEAYSNTLVNYDTVERVYTMTNSYYKWNCKTAIGQLVLSIDEQRSSRFCNTTFLPNFKLLSIDIHRCGRGFSLLNGSQWVNYNPILETRKIQLITYNDRICRDALPPLPPLPLSHPPGSLSALLRSVFDLSITTSYYDGHRFHAWKPMLAIRRISYLQIVPEPQLWADQSSKQYLSPLSQREYSLFDHYPLANCYIPARDNADQEETWLERAYDLWLESNHMQDTWHTGVLGRLSKYIKRERLIIYMGKHYARSRDECKPLILTPDGCKTGNTTSTGGCALI